MQLLLGSLLGMQLEAGMSSSELCWAAGQSELSGAAGEQDGQAGSPHSSDSQHCHIIGMWHARG